MARFPTEIPGLWDRLREWWLEATGQAEHIRPDEPSQRAFGRRFLLWLPVFAVAICFLGLLSFYFYSGWRAHDMARKAGESSASGELRLALLQAQSARRLRPWDAEVIRSQARVLAACQDPRSLAVWEEIGPIQSLTPGDRSEVMATMVRLGDEWQFARALLAVEAQDGPAAALAWRGRRALGKRNFTEAEKCFRSALAQDPEVEVRLEFVRLLSTLGTADAVAEAVQIIDSLAAGPESSRALALGLSVVPAGPATRLAWATRAFSDLRPGNEAVLPAAGVLLKDRHLPREDVLSRLRMIYTGTATKDRVAFARWLLDHDAPNEALVFARSSEAPGSREAFLVRADALSLTQDWPGLVKLIEAGSPLNPVATSLLRARAERGLGRSAGADESLALALRSSAARFQLPETLEQVDAAGQSVVGDRILLELCGDFAFSDYALRVARWRFSSRGEPRLRQQAFERARTASPRAPTVLDFQRREQLLAGQKVDPAETAEALAANPSNMDLRLTHALALLRQERIAEARRVLEPGEAIRLQLEASQKAVGVAVLAASGSPGEAMALARTIKSAHLTEGEYRLVYALVSGGSSSR